MSSNAEDLITKFEDLIQFIQDAQTQLNEGKIIKMDELGSTVAKLCAAVDNADQDTATRVKPLLADLIQNLDRFERNLQTHIEIEKQQKES